MKIIHINKKALTEEQQIERGGRLLMEKWRRKLFEKDKKKNNKNNRA